MDCPDAKGIPISILISDLTRNRVRFRSGGCPHRSGPSLVSGRFNRNIIRRMITRMIAINDN